MALGTVQNQRVGPYAGGRTVNPLEGLQNSVGGLLDMYTKDVAQKREDEWKRKQWEVTNERLGMERAKYDRQMQEFERTDKQRDLLNKGMENIQRGAVADVLAKDKSALEELSRTTGDVFAEAATKLGYDMTTEEGRRKAGEDRLNILKQDVPDLGMSVQDALMRKYSAFKPTREEVTGTATQRLLESGVDYDKAITAADLMAKTNFQDRATIQKERQALVNAQVEKKKAVQKRLQDAAEFDLKLAKEGKSSSTSYTPVKDMLGEVASKIGEGRFTNFFSKDLKDKEINAALISQRNKLANTYGSKTADAIVTSALSQLAANNTGIWGANVNLGDIQNTIDAVKVDFRPTTSGGSQREIDLANARAKMNLAQQIDISPKTVGSYEDVRRQALLADNPAILDQYSSGQNSRPTTTINNSGTGSQLTEQPTSSTRQTSTITAPRQAVLRVQPESEGKLVDLVNEYKENETAKRLNAYDIINTNKPTNYTNPDVEKAVELRNKLIGWYSNSDVGKVLNMDILDYYNQYMTPLGKSLIPDFNFSMPYSRNLVKRTEE